jgi:hypothetical protein
MTDVDLAYLAGIVDGEGYIGLTRHGKGYYLALAVNTTSIRLAEWILNTTGYGNKVQTRDEKTPSVRNRNRQPTHEWRVYGRQAAQIIRLLQPYLKVRDNQGRLASEFQQLCEAACSMQEKSCLGEEYRQKIQAKNLPQQRKRYLANRDGQSTAIVADSEAGPVRNG